MGSSSLLKTEHEITIKIVSFVIFAPSSDIFILNVKPGSSISILFWLIWTKKKKKKKKRKKKEEERGNCSSEYFLCIPFSIKDMAVTCFLRNDSSSVAKSSCAPGATPGVLVMWQSVFKSSLQCFILTVLYKTVGDLPLQSTLSGYDMLHPQCITCPAEIGHSSLYPDPFLTNH